MSGATFDEVSPLLDPETTVALLVATAVDEAVVVETSPQPHTSITAERSTKASSPSRTSPPAHRQLRYLSQLVFMAVQQLPPYAPEEPHAAMIVLRVDDCIEGGNEEQLLTAVA